MIAEGGQWERERRRRRRKERWGKRWRKMGAHWCRHLRERRCFNALVEEIVSSRILGSHSRIYTLQHTHTQHTHLPSSWRRRAQVLHPVFTHILQWFTQVLMPTWDVWVCVYAYIWMCASTVSINPLKRTYLCILGIVLTRVFSAEFITRQYTHQLLSH